MFEGDRMSLTGCCASLAFEIRFPVRGEGPGQSENATLIGPDFGFAKIDLSGGGRVLAEMVKIETVPSLCQRPCTIDRNAGRSEAGVEQGS